MKLSSQSWNMSKEVIKAIKNHKFNQELMNGTLDKDRFKYYLEQDTIYLRDFARCHAIIASKISLSHIKHFLEYSQQSLIAEQEDVHQYFRKLFKFKETGHITPATLSYTSYILRICAYEPIEVAVASVLPCFWVYKEVGSFIKKHSVHHNPYAHWIAVYSGEEFNNSVNQIINIYDNLADNTCESTKKKMLDAFYKSTCLEWHFWNDSYNKTVFNQLS